ncbi:dTMP kinase [Parvularcula dongshanensis]|uniref:Thymidylate kinase n=1 Tax=Parvularcula dongshanensis TaxID=1173995 RepID=A0A840I3X5_9PROT|nr:dTMP kinase [Parvularcula dongshanensis]MBB4659477.1 dTMP kinase [Parvularcula dongshanensis]
MTRHPRFVVFEGPEGAGKTTQIARLAARIAGEALLTREPGGTRGGEAVRAALLNPDAAWSPLAEALLMNAARDAHLREVVMPALDAGKTVLCDRFADSTEAYQGGGGGLPTETVNALRRWVCPVEPGLTLIFDLPVKEGLARASARGAADRFEAKGRAYHEAVRGRFLAIAQRPARVLIDARGTVEAVESRIQEAVSAHAPRLLTPLP